MHPQLFAEYIESFVLREPAYVKFSPSPILNIHLDVIEITRAPYACLCLWLHEAPERRLLQ